MHPPKQLGGEWLSCLAGFGAGFGQTFRAYGCMRHAWCRETPFDVKRSKACPLVGFLSLLSPPRRVQPFLLRWKPRNPRS